MKNELNSEIPLNKTGLNSAPLSQSLGNHSREISHASAALVENRSYYSRGATVIGSIPQLRSLPSNENIMNGNHLLTDKLGERIVFKRLLARSYEALLGKYHSTTKCEQIPDLNHLEQFYLNQIKHLNLLTKCMEETGADSSALTPSADLMSMGWQGMLVALCDPRTTFLQCLEIIWQMEQVDSSAWELLAELAEANELATMAINFQLCLQEQNLQLMSIKEWVREFNLKQQLLPTTHTRYQSQTPTQSPPSPLE
jgi:hypothetical protein